MRSRQRLALSTSWSELLPKFHLYSPRFMHGHRSTPPRAVLAFRGPQKRSEEIALVAAERSHIRFPTIPSNPIVELVEPAGAAPVKKIGIANSERLPIQSVGCKVIDALNVFAQCTPVNR